jgi:FMN phosphatase YigB (HAD superfamily)
MAALMWFCLKSLQNCCDAKQRKQKKGSKTLSRRPSAYLADLTSESMWVVFTTWLQNEWISNKFSETQLIVKLVSALRNQNLRVAALTNSGRFLIEKALAVLGCPIDVFDAVVTSSEVEPKPSLQSFRHTVDLLHC